MMTNKLQFFHFHFSINIQKKAPTDQNRYLQKLNFLMLLMLLMLIAYLFKIQCVMLNIRINQIQIIKNISVIFDEILWIIIITIYLILIMKYDCLPDKKTTLNIKSIIT